MTNNTLCQSCGMPLKKDPNGGGTETNGEKSSKYCSLCYENGRFKFEGTVSAFQTHCKKKMIESGYNPITAWLFTRGMKRLERWKNK